MAKKTKETGVATKAATIDALVNMGQDGIPKLLEEVNKKINSLKGGNSENESTKGTQLPSFGEIAKIDKVTTLIQAVSSVRARQKAYAEAAKELDASTTKFPFKLAGFSADTWVNDIKARYSILANKAELDRLNKIKKTLEENLSQEAKLKNDLAKIGEWLTDESPLE